MIFAQDDISNASHRMGEAKITYAKAISKFPNPNEYDFDGKCEFVWSGSFTAKDGTQHRASFWDWYHGLAYDSRVSIWVSNRKYLEEFKEYIEA